MTDADETPEEQTEPVKVKQVAIAAGVVAAALTAAVAFTVAGPVGVGIAAAGVAGTGYTAHRIRNPRKGTLLHSWLTRTRKTSTTKAGTLSWPFTGNQSRRALSKTGGSGKTRASKPITGTGFRATRSGSTGRKASSPKSGRAGSLLPKTTRSRAANSAGGALPKRQASRPVTRRTPAAPSASKPAGIRAPRTATKTPSRLTGRQPLVKGSPGSRSSSTRTPTKRSGLSPLSPGKGSRPGLTNSRSRHRPTGLVSPKASSRRRSGEGTTRGRSSTTARRGIRGRNPWLSTRGGQTLGKRSTDSRRTGRAGRLGSTLGSRSPRRGPLSQLRHRVTPDRGRDRTPNRTRLRPRPYARRTTGQLLRTSLRVPVRNRSRSGSRRVVPRFRRPTQRQAMRARRTLRLRSGVWMRRGAVWVAKTPARRWDRLWEKLPKAPLPITHYTERSGMKVPAGPKHKTPTPVPDPTPTEPVATVTPIVRNMIPVKQNGSVIYVSSPNDLIREAFQQMASFHPGSALEVEAWLKEHQETLTDIGQMYGVLADQMRDGMPFAAPVADSVREIGVAIGAVSGIAQNAHQTMRAAHTADFQRIEEPRPDEGMWDPGVNR